MTATLNYVAKFKENVEKATSKNLGSPDEIIETIKKVKMVNPPTYDAEKIARFLEDRLSTLVKLIDSYFASVFSRVYPMIDNELFNLKRYLRWEGGSVVEDTLEKSEKISCLTAPLFIFTPLSGTRIMPVGTWTLNGSKITITCTLPSPPDKIMEHSKKVLANYHRIMSEACDNPVISDLFTLENTTPAIGALWIPVDTCLSAKTTRIEMPKAISYDPALVLCVLKRWYLVTTWEIEEERPFEHYLREFSLGSLKEQS
jgi:hypothetical protein